MALAGAELLLYPTAIGSEPPNPDWDSSAHWQRVMQGHAAANLMPVVAANRIGHEVGVSTEIKFYGSSFIADNTGAKCAEMDRASEGVILQIFDLEDCKQTRNSWGLFRDRRPELYQRLITLDGEIE
jgi:N-carbamoylputrescine amidase